MKRCCSVEGCNRPVCARGWCSMHWQRWRDRGDPNAPARIRWDGRCNVCGAPPAEVTPSARMCRPCQARRAREWRASNREHARTKAAEWARIAHRRRRQAAIQRYGGRCMCCGESRIVFLAIDHVDGGGNRHRRSMSSTGKMVGGSNVFAWLSRHGFPPGFQVLCHNCNFAKSHGGCPHSRWDYALARVKEGDDE